MRLFSIQKYTYTYVNDIVHELYNLCFVSVAIIVQQKQCHASCTLLTPLCLTDWQKMYAAP